MAWHRQDGTASSRRRGIAPRFALLTRRAQISPFFICHPTTFMCYITHTSDTWDCEMFSECYLTTSRFCVYFVAVTTDSGYQLSCHCIRQLVSSRFRLCQSLSQLAVFAMSHSQCIFFSFSGGKCFYTTHTIYALVMCRFVNRHPKSAIKTLVQL